LEGGDETPGDHVEQLGLGLVEVFGFVLGRDDGEVSETCALLKMRLFRAGPSRTRARARVLLQFAAKIAERLADERDVIIRQVRASPCGGR